MKYDVVDQSECSRDRGMKSGVQNEVQCIYVILCWGHTARREAYERCHEACLSRLGFCDFTGTIPIRRTAAVRGPKPAYNRTGDQGLTNAITVRDSKSQVFTRPDSGFQMVGGSAAARYQKSGRKRVHRQARNSDAAYDNSTVTPELSRIHVGRESWF